MEKKLNAYDFIELVILRDMYQTPEAITMEILNRYDRYYKCSTIERRLREMFEKGLVESKRYPNKYSNASHSRWKLKSEEVIKPKPTLAVIAKEIGNLFTRIIKKGEGHC